MDAEPPEGNGGTCEYGGDKDASVFTGSLGIGSPFSDGGRICLLFWQSGGRRDAEIIFFIPYARIQIDDFFGSKGCGAAFGNRMNTLSIGPGMEAKHSVPIVIITRPKPIAVINVFLQRSMFLAA